MKAILVIVVALVAVNLAARAIWPLAACWFCTAGRHWSPSRRFFRPCFWCGGSGRRRRFGRWFLDLPAARPLLVGGTVLAVALMVLAGCGHPAGVAP